MRTTAGAGRLIRLNLRLDRVRLPIWVLGIVAIVVVSGSSLIGLYSTEAQIASYVALAQGNPTLVAISGPGFGFDDPNIGVVLVNEILIWGVIGTALMSAFLVTGHTRAEEEAERAELVLARMVGRHAHLAAAVVVVTLANVVVGVATLIGLVALGFELAGSLAISASFAAGGLVFMGLTCVAAQCVTTARGSLGLAVGALGVAYGLRAAGDLGNGFLSWLSPIGWAHRVRPFAGEQWWVLALSVAVAAVLLCVALVLSDRRDVGGGLLAQRLGPPTASAWVTRPVGLAIRLQRGSVLAWSIGVFVLGIVYGAVGRDVEQMFEDNPDMEQFIAQVGGASITDSYLSYTLVLGAMLAAAFVIASVLRLRTEEAAGRAEPILATPTRRTTWAASHLLVAGGGCLVLLVASGAGTGLGLAVAIGEPAQLPRMVVASVAHAPAVFVLLGLAFAAFAAVPRWSPVAWVPLALVVVVGLFAEPFRVPRWIRVLSPLEHTAGLPAAPFDPVPALVLAAVAVCLVTLGVVALGRRDVPSI